MDCIAVVYNCPPDPLQYVVARFWQPEGQPVQLWFWGSWDLEESANKAAAEIGGMVLERMD